MRAAAGFAVVALLAVLVAALVVAAWTVRLPMQVLHIGAFS